MRWTHSELVDAPQAAEPQVGDVHLVLVPVLVAGVDVADAGAFDQGDTFVARALGHKQQRGLVPLDGPTPAGRHTTTQHKSVSAEMQPSSVLGRPPAART